MEDLLNSGTVLSAGVVGRDGDENVIAGSFTYTFTDADGNVLHEETTHNLITTLGKNILLDTLLGGSSYTVTGPYMGLISSASFSAVSASDTMSSHSGWLEADSTNAPAYGSTRPTVTFSAASGGTKATSSTNSFVFTNSGTIEGAFMVLGSGASATTANTSGTLFNAGTLTAAQPVISGNTLTVSWSGTLS